MKRIIGKECKAEQYGMQYLSMDRTVLVAMCIVVRSTPRQNSPTRHVDSAK